MKKTVSINIGGIIFHIEEDGYEKLKNYLESVNKYFASFEDSGEIIADIESRIAEIFLNKLLEGRQTVTLNDVNELISTMGTTKDFEATIESDEPENKYQQPEEGPTYSEDSSSGPEEYTKLYRDTKRGLLGGVAAGIAHYFKIDPLWIRLIIIVLFINVFLGGISGATLLAYIILWIVLPPNENLADDKKIKKLFRNPDDRVLGGIASGIASYFGADKSVIRLLFVLSIFLGGSGLLLYIILWIITPEAKSITEKMQMQGEPVTLSNIEENVKRGLNVREGEENPLVKILLFPFRLIALIINGLGKILGPALKFLVELVRIAFGAILVIAGFTMMIAFTSALLGLLGIATWDFYINTGEFPLALVQKSIGPWPAFSLYLITFIPALAITLVGLVVILRRRVANPYFGWSLFGLWIIGLAMASFTIPRLVREFTADNYIREEQTFVMSQATPTLHLNDTGDDPMDLVSLRVRGHEDSVYRVEVKTSSKGPDRETAKENAKNVTYQVRQQGEDFYFDSNITFPDESEFRFQEVEATLYIPYNKTFRMDRELADILTHSLHMYGYRVSQMEENDWAFSQSGLNCLTCKENRIDRDKGISSRHRPNYEGKEILTYPFEDFNELHVTSFFDVEIRQGDTYKIELRGDEDDLDEIYLNQIGKKVEVNFGKDDWEWWTKNDRDKVHLYVTMPELEYLKMTGDCDGEVHGFDTENIEINLTGDSEIYLNVFPETLEIQLTGASEIDLNGRAEELKIDLVGASQVKGFGFEANRVSVDAVGASKAEVYARDELKINAAGVSKVKYRGTSNVSVSEVGLSKVTRD